jgi:hypothetical protein
MKRIRIYYNRMSNSLNIWLDDPAKEGVAEETRGGTIIIRDKEGRAIGFEIKNYLEKGQSVDSDYLPVEAKILSD